MCEIMLQMIRNASKPYGPLTMTCTYVACYCVYSCQSYKYVWLTNSDYQDNFQLRHDNILAQVLAEEGLVPLAVADKLGHKWRFVQFHQKDKTGILHSKNLHDYGKLSLSDKLSLSNWTLF